MNKSDQWSEFDLRRAIDNERSWRGVARALGRSPTSAGAIRTIRRHAERLGIDSSHFTGQRRWSDQDLRKAVESASSWTEVASQLGSSSGEAVASMKGHASRLGLEVPHLEKDSRRPLPEPLRTARMDPKRLRYAAEHIAAAWFVLQGYSLARPIEPVVYDLIVDFPDGLRRVQVKSTTCRDRRLRWQVTVGHRPGRLDRTATQTCYEPATFDFFFIVTLSGDLYLIPYREIAGRTTIIVDAYQSFCVGDASALLGEGSRAR